MVLQYEDWLNLIKDKLAKYYNYSASFIESLMNENADVIMDNYVVCCSRFKEQTDCKDMSTWVSGIVSTLSLLA